MTFLDLAGNVPQLSTNITATRQRSRVSPVAGAIGVVQYGVEHSRQVSGSCCVGGNFSLTFDGSVAVDVNLEDDGSRNAEYLREKLEYVINQGRCLT